MPTLTELFQRNEAWAKGLKERDPAFFQKLAKQQAPEYLWIGCADSRVPANDIVGLLPGELFVHRNIANVVAHTDLNCLSVIQYAVDVLKVRHIIVCGHYGCGGVQAALSDARVGLVDNWLRHVKDVKKQHAAELAELGEDERLDKLCERNVQQQVVNLGQTPIVRDAWARGQDLTVYGLIYRVSDGILRDLGLCVKGETDLEPLCR